MLHKGGSPNKWRSNIQNKIRIAKQAEAGSKKSDMGQVKVFDGSPIKYSVTDVQLLKKKAEVQV